VRRLQPELSVRDRRAASTVAVIVAKRAVRSAAVWGALFGVLILNEALSWHKNFPTVASREKFAHTLGANSAIAAIIGPARRVDTIGGFVAWRVFGLLIIVGAVWGLLTATRLLRREEDAGRWELLLAGRTTRRHAAAQAVAGLAAGWAVLWLLTAAFTVVAGSNSSVGFSASASLFYATATTASAAMFLAIGALTSQLAPTSRQANGPPDPGEGDPALELDDQYVRAAEQPRARPRGLGAGEYGRTDVAPPGEANRDARGGGDEHDDRQQGERL
jgi:putative exporter of polyketide antibiotics